MIEHLGVAILLGLTLGMGLWLLVGIVPALNRPRLSDRVAPYIVDLSETARLEVARRNAEPLSAIAKLFSPAVSTLRRILGSILGRPHELAATLRRAGNTASVDRYRTEQAAAALAGLAIGGLLAAMVLRSTWHNLPAALVLPPLFAAAGVAIRDLALRRQERGRRRRIASEYPTVLEFFALSLAAGEGIFDALVRISTTGRGELAAEFGRVVVSVRSGDAPTTALAEVAQEVGYGPLERTCDHIRTAMERGAPLVEVLRAQARDARDLAKRDLLEQAGRKEILMMVPLVLLVLPVTVLFAVFPSYFVLTTSF